MSLIKSWVESANSANTDFPLNNLPCGVFSRGDDEPRCGVAIGAYVLDLAAIEAEGLVQLAEHPVFDVPFWNEAMDLGADAWAELRAQLTAMLAEGSPKRYLLEDHLVPLAEVTLHMPFLVSEYT
ncbi:MAG: fumarylacetoacetase, partial [Paracoccaceae bacterium]|nr:fumarylacetoacetase [Paracoccaceae bacterium]